MPSPIYSPINDSEIESGDPITVSLGLRWAKNYLSVIQGSPSARGAGLGVWIAKSPGGGDPVQTAILTDETDTSLRLAPDGAGSVAWTAVVNCSGNLLPDGSILGAQNTTAPVESNPTDGVVFSGHRIQQSTANSRMLVIFSGECTIQHQINDPQQWQTATATLYRKRGGSSVALASRNITTDHPEWVVTVPGPDLLSGFLINFNAALVDCQNGDSFYVVLQLTGTIIASSKAWVNGSLTIASIN